jgi:hypothetical protein
VKEFDIRKLSWSIYVEEMNNGKSNIFSIKYFGTLFLALKVKG